jgi:hypothetical protein
MPPEHRGRRIGPFRVVPAAESVLDREASPGEECQGNREFHGPVGKDVQQQDTYGGGDHHVHGERRGRAEPEANGRPRVAMTREANMVLSGSSPRKITGKTAAATARLTLALISPPSRAGADD